MGKGGISDLAIKKGDVLHINPRDLHVKDDWNLRNMEDPSNAEAVDRAAKMIVANGTAKMPPLLCYWEDGKAYVEDGHLRLAGALRAIDTYGHLVPTVPVTTSPKDGTEADRVLSQIVRNSGKPFTPIEQGKVFAKLRELGMTDDDIATKSGLSRVYVAQLLDLQAAPAAVKKMVAAGEVSATLAIQTIKANKGDGKKTATALTEAVKTAKDKGKKKATAKDVAPAAKKPNLKKELRTIFQADNITHQVNDSGQHTITFGTKTWNRINNLLGIKPAQANADII